MMYIYILYRYCVCYIIIYINMSVIFCQIYIYKNIKNIKLLYRMVENVKVTLENLEDEINNINFEISKLNFDKTKINASIKIIKSTEILQLIDDMTEKIEKVINVLDYKTLYITGNDLKQCRDILKSLKFTYSHIVEEFDDETYYDTCDYNMEVQHFNDLFDSFLNICSDKVKNDVAVNDYDLAKRKEEWLENHDKLQEKHNEILNSLKKTEYKFDDGVFEYKSDNENVSVSDNIPKKKVKVPRVRCGSCNDDVKFYGAEDNSDIDDNCKRCNTEHR